MLPSLNASKFGEDDSLTANMHQDDCSRQSLTGGESSQWLPFQRFQRSRLQNYAQKGKRLVQRVEATTKTENISLPFTKRGLQHGEEWIRGAILCAWLTTAISVFNVIATVIAIGVSYSKPSGDRHFTYTELYRGDCSVTSAWTTGVHLVINVLSSALLAASNYVMQCMSAPSRADVDKAHSRYDWLDIGTLSIKNFWVMDGRRKGLWVLLFVSSLPIHMMYNSAIFSSISTTSYGTLVIPSDLRRNESLVENRYEAQSFYDQVGFSAEDILAERFNGTFRELSLSECSKHYNVEYNSRASTLLLVAERNNLRGVSSLAPVETLHGVNNTWMSEREWSDDMTQVEILAGNWNYPKWSFKNSEDDTWLTFGSYMRETYGDDTSLLFNPNLEPTFGNDTSLDDMSTLLAFIFNHNPKENQLGDFLNVASNWKNSSWAAQFSFRIDAPSVSNEDYNSSIPSQANDALSGLPNIRVSHCMTKDASQRCQLYLSLPICLAIIACNIVKVFCMYLTARTSHREIFLTLGDSLSSFLDKPDVTTKDRCFMSRKDMNSGFQCWTEITEITPINEIAARKPVSQIGCPQLLPRREKWLEAVSWKRWFVTYGLFLLCLGISFYLYFGASYLVSEDSPDENSFVIAQKLGMGKPSSSTIIVAGRNLIALVLLANAPQLVFSTLYLLCNSILTCMLSEAEYNAFATQRKPLRVSWPKGQQRSTYYLSLPYRYSFPLIAVSAAMHWLLSQCIFLVKIKAFDVHGQNLPEDSITACGHSPLAMFIIIIVEGVAMIVLVGFSLRLLRSNMPLASSCSAAISASCHPPPGDENASLKPVKWGEVPTDLENDLDSGQASVEGAVQHYAHCTFTSKDVTTPSMIGKLYC